nr:MAG TPA: hypothetical protein [Caudoviricetes sp.]
MIYLELFFNNCNFHFFYFNYTSHSISQYL